MLNAEQERLKREKDEAYVAAQNAQRNADEEGCMAALSEVERQKLSEAQQQQEQHDASQMEHITRLSKTVLWGIGISIEGTRRNKSRNRAMS